MTEDQINTAAQRWARGEQIHAIADYLGLSRYGCQRFMEIYRDLFPKRAIRTGKYGPRKDRNRDRRRTLDFIPKPKILRPDQMEFTTSTGYVCTMPRVSILEGSA
jgi:DNA-directed RNA polymerase subunit N (RpoN/RPB10)